MKTASTNRLVENIKLKSTFRQSFVGPMEAKDDVFV